VLPNVRERVFVYLIYLDDSSDNSDVQVIAAVMVPEDDVLIVESFLGKRIEIFVPEELRPKFEFHAFKLWRREGEFSNLSHEQVRELFEGSAAVVADAPGIHAVYGAVNLRALRASLYSTAQPIDVAFRLCMEGIHEWFVKNRPVEDIGILICDEMKPNVMKDMQQSYRAFRRRNKKELTIGNRISGVFDYLHDDLYFGDSAYSVGLQLADMCAFLIRRHLNGAEDTEYLYKRIESKIYFSRMEPNKEVTDGN
jgi:hypothetical protein